MRKILIGVFCGICLLGSIGCNRQIIDTKYKFTKAMIRMPDGTCRTVNVSKWRDFENSDQIQIIAEDGTVYIGHSCNILLMKEP